MQFNKPACSKSSLDKCIENGINELTNRFHELKMRRVKCLEVKCGSQMQHISDLVSALESGMQEIFEMYGNIFNIPLISTDRNVVRKEAVIAAILRNAFAEKKVIDQLYRTTQKSHDCALDYSHKFLAFLCLVRSGSPLPTDKFDAEGMWTSLRKRFVSIHETISEIHEKCFQFACAFEEALKKVKTVVERRGKQVPVKFMVK